MARQRVEPTRHLTLRSSPNSYVRNSSPTRIVAVFQELPRRTQAKRCRSPEEHHTARRHRRHRRQGARRRHRMTPRLSKHHNTRRPWRSLHRTQLVGTIGSSNSSTSPIHPAIVALPVQAVAGGTFHPNGSSQFPTQRTNSSSLRVVIRSLPRHKRRRSRPCWPTHYSERRRVFGRRPSFESNCASNNNVAKAHHLFRR
jgi:hypothetical protein